MDIERTYRIFISSTFSDLADARRAAISGVSFCRHVPVALDTYGPEDAADLEVISRETKKSHIYILILGYRYGQIPTGKNTSYTEIEFRHAEDAKKPILVFALPWDEIVNKRKTAKLDADEQDNQEKLHAFHKYVTKGNHFYKPFELGKEDVIEKHVIHRLSSIPSEENPPKGLVEEFDNPDEQIAVGAARNMFLSPIIKSIVGFEKLYKRTETNIEERIMSAKFFVETYNNSLEKNEIRGIFFESGSTPPFLAREFPESFWNKVKFNEKGNPDRNILTNNVLVYLHLWLEKHIPCGHFPGGEPEGTYGASYGPIANLFDKTPRFDDTPLNKHAASAIEQLKAVPNGLTKSNTSLIVMAASGLQLGQNNHNIVHDKEYKLEENDIASIKKYYGPHVGSYKNMVFKRYLIETGIPIVLMIDASKIDSPIYPKKCHFVLGNGLTWSDVCENQPFAILVGCESKKMDELINNCHDRLPLFQVTKSLKTDKYSAFILKNELFETEFPEL